MGAETKIEWCHATFNMWRGCTKVSPGCKHCYAETLSARNPAVLGVWGDAGTRVIASEKMWRQPLAWNAAAAKAGERHRVFCASLADVFEDRRELIEPRARLFKLIANTPHLDWLLLTKRPESITLPWQCVTGMAPWPNVWLGVSVEDQQRADERIPLLLKVPAAVRFLSCEPLLGPVDLGMYLRRGTSLHMALDVAGALRNHIFDGFIDRDGIAVSRPAVKAELERLQAAGVKLMPMGEECDGFSSETGCPGHHSPGLDWVICGGESGPGARPMHPDWARSLRDQCAAAGVPFFFKQWGEHAWSPDALNYSEAFAWCREQFGDARAGQAHSSGHTSFRVGKAKAGRLLDGRVHDEYPAPRAEVPHA